MRHLVLAPIWPPARYGGIEIIAKRLGDAIAETDEVVVLSVGPAATTVTRRNSDGVEVWEVPGHFFSPVTADSANAAVLEIARPLLPGIDVIHCHDWFLAAAAVVLAGRGIPLVGYFHTVKKMERLALGRPGSGSSRYSEEKQQQLATHSDIVAVYSDFMAESVQAAFDIAPGRIVTFLCGPTLPLELRPAPTARESGAFRITYLGRLAPEKGVDLLLDAYLSMCRDGLDSTLRVVGSGPIAQDLMDRAAASPFGARISFEAFIADPVELIEAYTSSAVVVVPSRFEAYGLVAAEALTLGVPVAVASTGGLPEIVGHGRYGELFGIQDPSELRRALHEVYANHEASSSRAALGRSIYAQPDLWNEAARQILGALLSYSAAASG